MGKSSDKAAGKAAEAPVQPVVLPADCRLAEVSALRGQLLDALKAPSSELDGAGVERVDGTAVQLLVAFCRDAKKHQHAVRWLGASDALREAAALLGVDRMLDLPAVRPA
ncbi:STAS domain-containing protein [Dyella sp. A6]|uniref:STAS domain-containing protein n=1 Tax=Dyella aluminiiresistens TaxID=3069105 RepID=UPI002E767580|nr:STAS domain-containing protein [Dyella sp. A6]